MLCRANCLHISSVYTHIYQQILATNEVLLQRSEAINARLPLNIKKKRIKRWCLSLTLLGASLGSLGKPSTELESMERKTYIV